MKTHLPQVTQLLMGAAFADQDLDGRELLACRQLVLQLVGGTRLPKELSEIMVKFDPARFDMDAAARPLRGLSVNARRKVLELIRTISEADEIIEVAEDVYLEAVARSMGLERSEFADLTLEPLEDDEIAELSDTELVLIEDD